MTTTRRPVARWYFSLRSPYSWLAHRQLTNRHPEVAAAVEWRPFWEPDARSAALLAERGGTFPYTPMSKDKHLYILQDVRRLARQAGVEPAWPIDRDPVWEVPHLAYLAASDADLGPRFISRAHQLRWEEGRNICDPAVMAELAAELGLPPDRFARAAEDEELRARGVEALLDVDRDGVFGVPFFVHRREKFWGLDRLDAFVRSVTGSDGDASPDARTEPGPVRVVLGTGGDQGHAGGCG
ncbi:2-hydroxychromene-2-carboxylate isomerase [Streptomyces huasconensis]|uniref:2-hydroxychromene-2-carboxylate isomerase n=1 Tax=Streptomyces huasconensis TaxID=1854574 RepID=UPI0033C08A11